MAYCIKCGKQNTDTARFCTGCGATLAPRPETPARTAITYDTNKTGKFNWMLWGSIALLAVAAGVYFIFFYNNKKAESGLNNEQETQAVPAVDTPVNYYVDTTAPAVVDTTAMYPSEPDVSVAVPLNPGVQKSETDISESEVDNVSQILSNFYQCDNDEDVSCLLGRFNFPVGRYYQLRNVGYETLHQMFTEAYNTKLNSHFIDIKWDNSTVQKNGNGYKAILYADYSFTTQKSPDDVRSRSIQIIILLNSNYMIDSIYEN